MSWHSSPHPISDLREWYANKRIIIQPDFQRRPVWSKSAKIMLMDTILLDIPMPKIFLSVKIEGLNTLRTVIDGQQRINAILEFLEDKFCLEQPYKGPFVGKYFSELPRDIQDDFLSYNIDYNEVRAISQEEIREIYSRVNKYSFPLNHQELRRADYPGLFLTLAEDLSVDEFWDEINLFSVANRRRLADVEYISELLVALIDGPQEKKEKLDDFYSQGTNWEQGDYDHYKYLFCKIIDELKILNNEFHIKSSRFKKKSDFYALFLCIKDFVLNGKTLKGKNLKALIDKLFFLDSNIAPTSDHEILKDYAIKCVSQANSKASREWRCQFLKIIFGETLGDSFSEDLNMTQQINALFVKM